MEQITEWQCRIVDGQMTQWWADTWPEEKPVGDWRRLFDDKAQPEELATDLTYVIYSDRVVAVYTIPIPPPPVITGYDTGLGYYLGVEDGDQIAFTKISSGLMLLGVPDAYPMEIKDTTGQMHAVTFGQFKVIMSGYIPYCYSLWQGN
jgi:hypothetical protein